MDAGMIIAAARGWLTVPYKHQGRNRFGVDCVGLLVQVGKDCGFFPDQFDYADYGREPTGQLDALMEKHLVQIPAPVPGCIVQLRWWKAGHHVGIIGQAPEYPTLIHSLFQYGEVREHRFGEWHAKRVTSCWTYRGARL